MVASRAQMQTGGTAMVAELLSDMAALAERQEWDQVEDITSKVRHALLQVPEQERRDALLQARRTLERIREHAERARGEVADRLSAVRRGRDAALAYGTAASEARAELR